MDLLPGKLVVLEGIDASGKSTQMELLNKHFPDGRFTHQPSGSTAVGSVVYQLTEQVQDIDPLARQFLHLASHAEHYAKEIIPTLSTDGMFMDRCWMSAIAYGWHCGRLNYLMEYEDFERMVRMPTQGIIPAVTFVFLHPWHRDLHNSPDLIKAYEAIAHRYNAYVVPALTEEETTAWIINVLKTQGLLAAV